jgi:uncharacterized protein (TIGR02594 family)
MASLYPLVLILGCSEALSFDTPKKFSEHTILAIDYLGMNEVRDRAELISLMNVDPLYYEWCAAFINSILDEAGIPSNSTHRFPLLARSYLDWGVKISPKDIEEGDIVVFPRGNQGWQGHVGIYLKTVNINNKEYYSILGGNQDNGSVSLDLFLSRTSLGIRRYEDS